MLTLLTPRFWIGLAIVALLAFTHVFVYKAGRAAVRAQWDADITMRMNDALVAEQAARAKEQDLIVKNQKVSAAYAAEKKRRVADAAVAAGRLSDLESALTNIASADTSATGRADDPAIAVARQCARSLVLLDEYAQGLAGQTRGLQDYAKQMLITP